MVSVLAKNKALPTATDLHSFLRHEMQLPLRSKPQSIETFAAFMGLMRSCNPLHAAKAATRALLVECPFVRRFPEVLTGKLSWYKDVSVSVSEVLDVGGDVMDERKMWRLLVWIFLGNGGRLHQAWHGLKNSATCKTYKASHPQALEVLSFVMQAVARAGNLMNVIGSDGLDKKSRLAHKRILYLLHWHRAVPGLVRSYHEGARAFHDALLELPGLRGELTRKEVLILLACSRHRALREVGAPLLPFGQGAKNGAAAFLSVPMQMGHGVGATKHYHYHLSKKIPALEKCMRRLFPSLPKKHQKITLGDIEPCLCAAFVYARLVRSLRQKLGKACPDLLAEDWSRVWGVVLELKGPAGFYAYGADGKPETGSGHVAVPKLTYKDFRVAEMLPPRQLNKKAMFKLWVPGYRLPPTKPPRRPRAAGAKRQRGSAAAKKPFRGVKRRKLA